jgi:hypothetical protein
MPLSSKGKKIKKAMMKPKSEGGYGKEKGERVFYASQNKGTITGTEKKQKKGLMN